MKNFTLSILLFFTSPLITFSQTEPPKFQFGMSEGAAFESGVYVKLKSAARIYAGYFFKKNWLVGISPYFSTATKHNGEFISQDLGFQTGANLYTRKYFSTHKLQFFAELGAGVGYSNTNEIAISPMDDGIPTEHLFTHSEFLGLGVSYQLSNHIGIELSTLINFFNTKRKSLSPRYPDFIVNYHTGNAVLPNVGIHFSF